MLFGLMNAQLKIIKPARRGEVCLVSVTGEADLQEAAKLQDALFAQIDTGIQGLVVDLSRCTFIDSTTLKVLVSSQRKLRAVGGERIAVVAAVGGIVHNTFMITGLDRAFRLVTSADAALATFSPARSVTSTSSAPAAYATA
jgi:anti-anti-sigma factor